MAILSDIEVRIASKTTGKALDEYDKPNTVPPTDELSIEKFVEAETEQEFHIEVFVKSGFEFYQSSGMEIGIKIDGGRIEKCQYWSKAQLQTRQLKEQPVVLDRVIEKEGTQYYSMNFRFSALTISRFFLESLVRQS